MTCIRSIVFAPIISKANFPEVVYPNAVRETVEDKSNSPFFLAKNLRREEDKTLREHSGSDNPAVEVMSIITIHYIYRAVYVMQGVNRRRPHCHLHQSIHTARLHVIRDLLCEHFVVDDGLWGYAWRPIEDSLVLFVRVSERKHGVVARELYLIGQIGSVELITQWYLSGIWGIDNYLTRRSQSCPEHLGVVGKYVHKLKLLVAFPIDRIADEGSCCYDVLLGLSHVACIHRSQ